MTKENFQRACIISRRIKHVEVARDKIISEMTQVDFDLYQPIISDIIEKIKTVSDAEIVRLISEMDSL